MTSARELLEGLRGAAGDAGALRDAVRRCGKAMAETGVDRIALADALLALARHPDERVRKEVAEVSHLFPDAHFDAAYAILSKDRAGFVEGAARRTLAKKTAERKEQAKLDARGRELMEAIEELARFGAEPRRIGQRVAKLASAEKGGRAQHELGRAAGAIGTALVELDAELSKDAPGPATLSAHAMALRERHEDLMDLLAREAAPGKARAPRFRRVLLGEVVQTSLDRVRAAGASGVDVAIDVPRDLELEADKVSLRQAIENTLKNAIEAQRGRPGAVRVSARVERDGALVELTVADAGSGMTEAELARLSIPYESKKHGGTGVGMTAARQAVEDTHRGTMVVESEKGVGTRVVMRLPAKQVRA